MPTYNRRTLMAAGTTLAAGGMFSSVSAMADEEDADDETRTVTVSAVDSFTQDPIEGAEVRLVEYEDLETKAEGMTDEDGTVDLQVPDGEYLVQGDAEGYFADEAPEPIVVDGEDKETTIPLYPEDPPDEEDEEEEPEEDPSDDDGADREPEDVKFDYEYDSELPGDEEVDIESKLELSSAEFVREEDPEFCSVRVEAQNLTDDKEITVYFHSTVGEVSSYETARLLEPGESISLSLELRQCPERDPDEGMVSAWVPGIADIDEEEEEEPEEEEEDPEEEEPEEPEEEEEEEPIEVDPSLELSVSAPDSVTREDTACFDVTVRNHGDDVTEVEMTLEVGEVTESSTAEIAPGDCYASFHTVAGSEFCPGDIEWTVTAGEERESGTLTVIDE